jgi:hypothetical protein
MSFSEFTVQSYIFFCTFAALLRKKTTCFNGQAGEDASFMASSPGYRIAVGLADNDSIGTAKPQITFAVAEYGQKIVAFARGNQ